MDNDFARLLSETDLFGSLNPEVMERVGSRLEMGKVGPGELLVEEGVKSDALYLIMSGEMRVFRLEGGERMEVARLGSKASFGEVAFLTGERRTASVDAGPEGAEYAMLERAAYEELSASHPDAMAHLASGIIRRFQQTQIREVLYTTESFSHLPKALLESLYEALEIVTLSCGDTLFEPGSSGASMYFIISGRIRAVTADTSISGRTVYEFARGETFGELELITQSPRIATTIATRDTLLARLNQDEFMELTAKWPHAMMHCFAGGVVAMLTNIVLDKVSLKHTVVGYCVVPLSQEVPASLFCERLTAALSAHGRTLHLNAEKLDNILGRKGAAQTMADEPFSKALALWLNKQEQAYQHVVFQADATTSSWTKRCLRHADRVLLLGDANGDPEPKPIETVVIAGGVSGDEKSMLILLGSGDGKGPSGTAAWLEPRELSAHYHVCLDEDVHFERVSRFLLNKGVGLVLSGGGARGFAYIGAIQALQEAGIPIDMVGGTSAGAAIGAMLASGWETETMLQRAQSSNYRVDYTLPFVAIMAGTTLTKVTRGFFGENCIEDLPLPFFCVTTDLSSSIQRVHRSGSLWRYVRASQSVPGLLPPFIEDGSVLVDGGVCNNLPIDVMRSASGSGPIIALDVSAPLGLSSTQGLEGVFSGWRRLGRQMNPLLRTADVPSLGDILTQTAMMKSAESSRSTQHLADLYLSLPAGGFGLTDFKYLPQLVELGYKSVTEQLENIDSEGLRQRLTLS